MLAIYREMKKKKEEEGIIKKKKYNNWSKFSGILGHGIKLVVAHLHFKSQSLDFNFV